MCNIETWEWPGDEASQRRVYGNAIQIQEHQLFNHNGSCTIVTSWIPLDWLHVLLQWQTWSWHGYTWTAHAAHRVLGNATQPISVTLKSHGKSRNDAKTLNLSRSHTHTHTHACTFSQQSSQYSIQLLNLVEDHSPERGPFQVNERDLYMNCTRCP